MSSIFSRHAIVGAIAAAAALGASRAAEAQGTALVTVDRSRMPMETPASKAEEREARNAAHSASAVWRPGYWTFQGKPLTAPNGGWAWVAGRWEEPPVPGATWTEGRWGWNQGWWTWLPAHWETPATRGSTKGE